MEGCHSQKILGPISSLSTPVREIIIYMDVITYPTRPYLGIAFTITLRLFSINLIWAGCVIYIRLRSRTKSKKYRWMEHILKKRIFLDWISLLNINIKIMNFCNVRSKSLNNFLITELNGSSLSSFV